MAMCILGSHYASASHWTSSPHPRHNNNGRCRSANIGGALRQRSLGKTSGRIGHGMQGCQVFSLYQNLLAPPQRAQALQVLLDDIRGPCQGHLSTGIFGTKFLLDVLSREGHAEMAYAIVNQDAFPGWGQTARRRGHHALGALEGERQHLLAHHPMFGSSASGSISGWAVSNPMARPWASIASPSGRKWSRI